MILATVSVDFSETGWKEMRAMMGRYEKED